MKRIFIISATLLVALPLSLGVLFVALAGKGAKHSPQMITMSSALVVKGSPTQTPAKANVANTMNANANVVVKVGNTHVNANTGNVNVTVNTNTYTYDSAYDPVTGIWDVSNCNIPKGKKILSQVKRKYPEKVPVIPVVAKVKKVPATHKKVVKPFKPKRVTAQLPKKPPDPPPNPGPKGLSINSVAEKQVYYRGERIAIMAIISGGTPPYKLYGNDEPLPLDEKSRSIWVPKKLPDVGTHTFHLKVVDAKKKPALKEVSVTVVEPPPTIPPAAKTENKPNPPPPFQEDTGSLRFLKTPSVILLLFWVGFLFTKYRKLPKWRKGKKPVLIALMAAPTLAVVLFIALL